VPGPSLGTFFAIILDKNDTGDEEIWYVTKSASTIDALQAQTEHNDTITAQYSKKLRKGKKRAKISLLNTHFKVIDHGYIYELPHI